MPVRSAKDTKLVYFYMGSELKKNEVHMDGTVRANIKIGMRVKIVLKKDQRSGNLTEGIVSDILTNAPNHPHGIKVRFRDGQVGRVKGIPEDAEDSNL